MLKHILTLSWRTRVKRAKKERLGDRKEMMKEKGRGGKKNLQV